MYKRHGITVRKVLEGQLRLHAGKLIDRTLEDKSLLALAIGQNYLPRDEHLAGDEGDSSRETPILTKLDEILKRLEPGTRPQGSGRKGKTTFPKKRDTTLFAAIVGNHKGLKYCDFLDKHRVKPKWSEDGHRSYRESYLASGSYRKKVQDEKCRAKQRLSKYPGSVILEAFVTHFNSEFDTLSLLWNSRNSRGASKNLELS
jgi:hypothetical protein